jgi:hypothetical protein
MPGTTLYTLVKALDVPELDSSATIGYTVPDGCCDQWLSLNISASAFAPEPGPGFLAWYETAPYYLGLWEVSGDGPLSVQFPMVYQFFDQGTDITFDASGAPYYFFTFQLIVIRYGATLANGFLPPLLTSAL